MDQMSWRDFGAALRMQARSAGHRFLVVVNGERGWSNDVCQGVLGEVESLRIGYADGEYSAKEARGFLGREFDSIIYDGTLGIDADAFGVISGTIRAGGLFVLLWNEKPEGSSNFLQRVDRLLQGDQVIRITQAENPELPILSDSYWSGHVETEDQNKAIAAVRKVVSGQRRRPVVLIADRGRGKSAALGIAAKQLLAEGMSSIIVTGHSRQSAEKVFSHAGAVTGLQWHEVETLLTQQSSCELLLIDEAAGVPLSQLIQLLRIYPRIAMATTVHGYEGSGRGFMLRFSAQLNQLTRGWRACYLEQPIRWAVGDPLEAMTNRLLMLDAELSEIKSKTNHLGGCEIGLIDQQILAQDEELLREVFGLLVLAHYKTRPRDLVQLLDNPALRIYLTKQDNRLVGVALVVLEGKLDQALVTEIFKGRRRPPGQVLPELLAGQMGVLDIAGLKMARIMRIVVHPAFQGRGIGNHLIRYIKNNAAVDIVGTNFSVSPALAGFWQRNQFSLVRVGSTRTRQSGAVSAVYLAGISEQGRKVVGFARDSFVRNFSHQLKSVLRTLEPEIVSAVLVGQFEFDQRLTEDEFNEVAGFCYGGRGAESIGQSLNQLAFSGLVQQSLRDDVLVIERVLQGKDWSNCLSLDGEEGMAAGLEKLRTDFTALLEQEYSDQVAQFRARLNGS